MSKLGLQKGSVLRHMVSVIQPILEKGIVDHSIIHRVLVEYFSIAGQVLPSPSPSNSACFFLQATANKFNHGNRSSISIEFFWKSSVTDIIQQLSSPLLVRMIGTRDGAKIGILCVKYGNAKVSLATSFFSIELCSVLVMVESDILLLLHFLF